MSFDGLGTPWDALEASKTKKLNTSFASSRFWESILTSDELVVIFMILIVMLISGITHWIEQLLRSLRHRFRQLSSLLRKRCESVEMCSLSSAMLGFDCAGSIKFNMSPKFVSFYFSYCQRFIRPSVFRFLILKCDTFRGPWDHTWTKKTNFEKYDSLIIWLVVFRAGRRQGQDLSES
jgi:hypothetical protein